MVEFGVCMPVVDGPAPMRDICSQAASPVLVLELLYIEQVFKGLLDVRCLS